MDIVIVKASNSGEGDRTYITRVGRTERVAVHVVHDLPHLVVESLFEIGDGLWGEVELGRFEAANRAVTARDPRRRKQGHIVSGGAQGARLRDWLTDGHRLAKAATNSVVNRSHDGPDTAAGVRARLAKYNLEGADVLLDRLDDETIEMAILSVGRLYGRWSIVPAGETLRLTWPLQNHSSRVLPNSACHRAYTDRVAEP